jgi:hypothetical protein
MEPGFPGASERTGTGISLRLNALDPGFHSVGTGVSRGRQNALEPGFHCVGTHWIRGFMTFRRIGRTRIVRLMVPVGPESGLRDRAIRPDGGARVSHRSRRIRFYPSGKSETFVTQSIPNGIWRLSSGSIWRPMESEAV